MKRALIFLLAILLPLSVLHAASLTTIQPPGGRLTLITHTPVLPIIQDFPDGSAIVQQDITTQTVYYDCYNGGNSVPRFNGGADIASIIPSCETSDTLQTSGAGVVNMTSVFDFLWTASGLCHVTDGSGKGWAGDTATNSRTGTTHTTTSITGLSTNVIAAGWWVGMAITDATHSDIPANTVIVAIGPDGTSLTLSQAATGSHVGDTLTATGATNQLRGFGYSQVHNTRGYWTNVNSITHCYAGAIDIGPVVADQGTVLGTACTPTGAGLVTVSVHQATGGGNSVICLWNAYNQVVLSTSENDLPSADIHVTSSTYALLDASTANRISWVDGLQQSFVWVGIGFYGLNSSGSTIRVCEFVDWISGRTGPGNCVGGDVSPEGALYYGTDVHQPYLGFHYIQLVQQNVTNTGIATIPATTNPGFGIYLPM